MEHCLIFSREILYVTIVLCLNILYLKAVNKITVRQIRTSLRKHEVIKVCSIEYLTHTNRISVATFKSWIVHKIIQYLTLGLLSSIRNIYHSTTAYFFDPPCIILLVVFNVRKCRIIGKKTLLFTEIYYSLPRFRKMTAFSSHSLMRGGIHKHISWHCCFILTSLQLYSYEQWNYYFK